MRGRHKWILNSLFLIALTALTLFAVLRNRDLSRLQSVLGQLHPGWCAAGFLLVVLFILGEALISYRVLHSMQVPLGLGRCCLCAFVGFFFSCITPFAGGGQPAQVVYLRRNGVPTAAAIPMLVLITVTYKLVLVIYGIAVLLVRPAPVWQTLAPVRGWYVLGLILTSSVVGFFLLLILLPDPMERLLTSLLTFLERRFPSLERKQLQPRLRDWMHQYRSAAGCVCNAGLMLQALGITLVQRTLHFAVCWCALRALDIHQIALWVAAVQQAMIYLGTDLLPLPGGTGANEVMFLEIYTPLLGEAALPVLLVSRSISYYGELLISAAFTAVAFTCQKRGHTYSREEDTPT